jgi:hypothetical protein
VRIDDGGAAFPGEVETSMCGIKERYPVSGMTLRDWFAGQALAGLASEWQTIPGSYEDTIGGAARTAYGLADALLAERDKPEGNSKEAGK